MGQHQTAFFVAGKKCLNASDGIAQNKIGARGGAVADTQPNDFGSAAKQSASLKKVGIFGDDDEAIVPGILPDFDVRCSTQPAIRNVYRAGVDIGEGTRQTRRQVLVKEELHSGTISNLRSASAAKARQARMSVSVRSGKSARISSGFMPPAR